MPLYFSTSKMAQSTIMPTRFRHCSRPRLTVIRSAKALKGILQEGLRIGRREANVGLLPVDGSLQFARRSRLQFAAQEFAEIIFVTLPDKFDAISRKTFHASLSKVESVLVET